MPDYANPVEAGRWDLTPAERAAVPMAEVAAALMRGTGVMEGRREVIVDDLICHGTRLVNAARQESDEEFTDGEVLVLGRTRCGAADPADVLLDPVLWASLAADWLDDWDEDDEPHESLASATAAELRANHPELAP